MSLRYHPVALAAFTPEMRACWAAIPAATASDALGRGGAMDAAIKPVAPGMRLLGPARTVRCVVADNSALHGAIERARPGDVLVCDGAGHCGAALWGGLLSRAGLAAGLAGVVIDGAVRDAEEIASLGLPVFARAVVPAGPHKGAGGEIDGPISCAGVPVRPGDLILGDGDGVAVVGQAGLAETLATARALREKEAAIEARLAQGTPLATLFPLPEPTPIR